MKLKTSTIQAIEKGLPVQNSTDIELLGTEALSINEDYAKLIEQKEISSSQNSFLSLFGLNVKLFYSITLTCEDRGFTERGLGYIEQNDNKFYLKRNRPFYLIENDVISASYRPRPVVCGSGDYVIASSYTPTTFIEVLTDANSIITSCSPHLPTSVVVDKNSVLGRREDNVESIPISSLVDNGPIEEAALNSIKEHTKNLVLKSSKVDVKRLTANDIQLNARKSAPERKGVIYYDENDDCIKYYDGTKWRRLMWQEDGP